MDEMPVTGGGVSIICRFLSLTVGGRSNMTLQAGRRALLGRVVVNCGRALCVKIC